MNNKIAFIICTNDQLYCEECMHYISLLEIPSGYAVDVYTILEAEYMTKAYNEAMHSIDARYKIYMHQDVFIINKHFLYDMLEIFKNDRIGLLGIVGQTQCGNMLDITKAISSGVWDSGIVYTNDTVNTACWNYGKGKDGLSFVQMIDGLLMATQYDVPWRDDIFCGWDFYDISQSMEFLKRGYSIVVPELKVPWVIHDCGILNYKNYRHWHDVFVKEYGGFISSLKPKEHGEIPLKLTDTADTKSLDLYEAREYICSLEQSEFDATIVVVAYNRLEVTKLCIESVLKYTQGIRYKLLLVYNENEQGAGILEYFNSVAYPDKLVIHINRNEGAPFAYQQIMKYAEGKYFVHLPNDVIVTYNWLSNLIKCAESDKRIGMVNPVSSNTTNLQGINFEFQNLDEMQQKAKLYNVSDPTRWQERMRLITLATLFTKECLSVVGNIFDVGFMHDFGDDDIAFRVRRAGYKTILAGDTWVHHQHDITNAKEKDPVLLRKSIESGRKNFQDKYFGVDAWDDVNNFIAPWIKDHVDTSFCKEPAAVLGIDVKCGTPILDIRNVLREQGIFETKSFAFTQDAKYYLDLKTICDGDVVCDRVSGISSAFTGQSFDYITIGRDINEYQDWKKVIKDTCRLLNMGGQLFVSVKNTNHIWALLKLLGYHVNYKEEAVLLEPEALHAELKAEGMEVQMISEEAVSVSGKIVDFVKRLLETAKPEDASEQYLLERLLTDKWWFKIIKK